MKPKASAPSPQKLSKPWSVADQREGAELISSSRAQTVRQQGHESLGADGAASINKALWAENVTLRAIVKRQRIRIRNLRRALGAEAAARWEKR